MVERLGKQDRSAPRIRGDALDNGFSVMARRPVSRPPGDIRSLADADRIDERAEMWSRYGMSSRDSRIMSNTRENDPTIVGPLDDNEEYF